MEVPLRCIPITQTGFFSLPVVARMPWLSVDSFIFTPPAPALPCSALSTRTQRNGWFLGVNSGRSGHGPGLKAAYPADLRP